jgi:hypothetical protein
MTMGSPVVMQAQQVYSGQPQGQYMPPQQQQYGGQPTYQQGATTY